MVGEQETHTDPISSRPDRTATTMRPDKPCVVVGIDEQGLVGDGQVREDPARREEFVQLLRTPADP